MVASCENADVSQEQNANNDSSLAQRQSTMFDYIESTQIQYLSVVDNKLYSLHKQEQVLILNKDFYDMPSD